MKKVIFMINVDNHIDLITNSSSELFVLQGTTGDVVRSMIKEQYPDFLNEYEDVKNIADLSLSELNQYIDYSCSAWGWPAHSKEAYSVLPGLTFDELYEEDEVAWNGQMQYKLRNNKKNSTHNWDRNFVTEENKEEILNKISPNKDMWFLYSLDENPDGEFQDKLSNVAMRYHLG